MESVSVRFGMKFLPHFGMICIEIHSSYRKLVLNFKELINEIITKVLFGDIECRNACTGAVYDRKSGGQGFLEESKFQGKKLVKSLNRMTFDFFRGLRKSQTSIRPRKRK